MSQQQFDKFERKGNKNAKKKDEEYKIYRYISLVLLAKPYFYLLAKPSIYVVNGCYRYTYSKYCRKKKNNN